MLLWGDDNIYSMGAPIAKDNKRGFTIVELLVVIVVMGILATVTVVAYNGITQKATEVTIKSDLDNGKKQLESYQVVNGSYPTSLDEDKCPDAPVIDKVFCLKPSPNNTYTYSSNGKTFSIGAKNSNGTEYATTNSGLPQNLADWKVIGTQIWAKANLNVGARINGYSSSDNGIVEKYCYNNNEANCISSGAMYQWDEAMQYSLTEGAQGICPANSHIPTDNDWKILEIYIGMTQAQADSTGWRGSLGGSLTRDVLLIPLAGHRVEDGTMVYWQEEGNLWSSSLNVSGDVWYRSVAPVYEDGVNRSVNHRIEGYPVRCISN